VNIRQATLDDTQALSRLFRAHIHNWQRLNSKGQVEDVPYDALTIYERWLHGGPWMSVETAAIHLSHLLRGAGIPLLVENDGKVIGYVELYHGQEPAPFGHHLSMTHPTVHPDLDASRLETALLNAAREESDKRDCERLLVAVTLAEARSFYEAQGLEKVMVIRRYTLPAKSGQGFYVTAEVLEASAADIQTWHMPVGRLSSARQQWETLWPGTWDAIPEMRQRRTHRMKFNASGQDAYVCCQQQLYVDRNADIFCWSPRPLTSQLLTAIRDWSHREGYRTLVMAVNEDTAKILGSEAEADGYFLTVYGIPRE
jgi:ribosomal protein S18 acetylase RimI-like enzyme